MYLCQALTYFYPVIFCPLSHFPFTISFVFPIISFSVQYSMLCPISNFLSNNSFSTKYFIFCPIPHFWQISHSLRLPNILFLSNFSFSVQYFVFRPILTTQVGNPTILGPHSLLHSTWGQFDCRTHDDVRLWVYVKKGTNVWWTLAQVKLPSKNSQTCGYYGVPYIL